MYRTVQNKRHVQYITVQNYRHVQYSTVLTYVHLIGVPQSYSRQLNINAKLAVNKTVHTIQTQLKSDVILFVLGVFLGVQSSYVEFMRSRTQRFAEERSRQLKNRPKVEKIRVSDEMLQVNNLQCLLANLKLVVYFMGFKKMFFIISDMNSDFYILSC